MRRAIFGVTAILFISTAACFSQGTAFTYQGRLNNGANPANGTFDLQFALYDAVSGGSQQGVTVTNSATTVSNGLFTVTLDFGNYFPGTNRWLEISVRTNESGAFTTLIPRQALTPTPYAITAENLAGSLLASQLSGSVADGLLSANVALRAGGNTFSGDQIITGGQSGSFFLDNRAEIFAKNNLGNYEGFLFPRWSDNGSYLNYGSGGFFIRNNSSVITMVMQGNGNVGIGTVTPGQQLQVGDFNNPADGLIRLACGVGNNSGIGRIWDIGVPYGGTDSSGSNYCFVITDPSASVARFLIDWRNGNIGIGTSLPNSPLTFAQALGDKISLWTDDDRINSYGFGIQGGQLQIHTDTTAADIVFGGGNSANMTETMRIKGSGNVGIGTPYPSTLLQVGGTPGAEGIIQLSSTSLHGSALRAWNIGVANGDANTAGKFFSFSVQDTGSPDPSPAFLIRWDSGFVGLGTTNPATKLDVAGEVTMLACNITSDRNAKEQFKPVNSRELLNKVAQLPISEWQYKTQTDARHIGPMAQDFREAFGLGRDDKHITSLDADGVALAAIQGLNQKVEELTRDKDERIRQLENEIRQLKEMLARLAAGKSTAP